MTSLEDLEQFIALAEAEARKQAAVLEACFEHLERLGNNVVFAIPRDALPEIERQSPPRRLAQTSKAPIVWA